MKRKLNPINEVDLNLLEQPELSHQKSEILCRMAIFSYSEESVLRRLIGNESLYLEILENRGFVVWNDDGVVVVVFAGTQSLDDWLKNVQAFFPASHPIGGSRHNGFYDVWRQNSDRVIDILDNRIPENSKLWLIGHSLGGAVATGAASEFISHRRENLAYYNVITFGAPRYGDEAFQQAYDQTMINRHWFYVNEGDPVSTLPPNWIGYRHTGEFKYFSQTGELLNISKRDAGFELNENSAEGIALDNWHSLDKAINQNSRTKEQLEQLVRTIMEDASEPRIEIANNGVFIDDTDGELEGNKLWDTSAHKIELYWKQIKSQV